MKPLFSYIILVGIFLTSCRKDNCKSDGRAIILFVDGPKVGTKNEEITFGLDIKPESDCFIKGSVTYEVSGSSFEKIISAKAQYEGCGYCNPNGGTYNDEYKFKTSIPGTYYLKFFKWTNTYIVDTLVIN